MNKCPVCGKTAISPAKKLTTSKNFNCIECGESLVLSKSLTRKFFIYFIALIILVEFAPGVSGFYKSIFAAILFVAYMVFMVIYLPLEKDKSEPQLTNNTETTDDTENTNTTETK